MNYLKLWLNIAPFIPMLGVPIAIYQLFHYNTEYKNIGKFGLNSTFLTVTCGTYQGLLGAVLLIKLLNYLL